jgi:hypothetical protein
LLRTVARKGAPPGPPLNAGVSQTPKPTQVVIEMKFSLAKEFPDFAADLTRLLKQSGEGELADTLSGLTVVERCRCGDDFCATMYTYPPPRDSWGRSHRNVSLDPEHGFLILDVLDREIVGIEVLYRQEIREQLLKLLP